MQGALIAIVGSNNLRDGTGRVRTDAEAVSHEAQVREATRALGRELRCARCGLLVYSADAAYIEADVVTGYCSASNEQEGAIIHYRHPKSYSGQFGEQGTRNPLFKEHLDHEEGWEASFYRSLAEADGILLVGGGASTTIAGHVALVLGKAVMPITCFRGGAAGLHPHVQHAPNAPTEDELQAVLAWRPAHAEKIVASLTRRHAALQARGAQLANERTEVEKKLKKLADSENLRRAEERASLAVLAFALVSVLAGYLVWQVSGTPYAMPLFLLTLAAMGGCGACVQLLRTPLVLTFLKTALLGLVAGVLFGVLYLVPQFAGSAGGLLLPTNGIQFALTMIVAFGSGMAAEAVLDAFRTKSVERAPGLVEQGLATPATSPQPNR